MKINNNIMYGVCMHLYTQEFVFPQGIKESLRLTNCTVMYASPFKHLHYYL